MQKPEYESYLSDLVKINDLKNEEQFVDFLKSNPHIKDNVIKNANEVFWLFFESNTYDGWYCINNEKYAEYNVYFQERGRTQHGSQLTTRIQEEAIVRVLISHGSINFQTPN